MNNVRTCEMRASLMCNKHCDEIRKHTHPTGVIILRTLPARIQVRIRKREWDEHFFFIFLLPSKKNTVRSNLHRCTCFCCYDVFLCPRAHRLFFARSIFTPSPGPLILSPARRCVERVDLYWKTGNVEAILQNMTYEQFFFFPCTSMEMHDQGVRLFPLKTRIGVDYRRTQISVCLSVCLVFI